MSSSYYFLDIVKPERHFKINLEYMAAMRDVCDIITCTEKYYYILTVIHFHITRKQ